MLEPRREALDRARNLRIDGVTLSARRRGVVRFIEDQEGAWAECPEPVAERSGVGLVDKQSVGDKKTGMGGPRIDAETSLTANPCDEIFVEDFERQTEALLEFILPLEQH